MVPKVLMIEIGVCPTFNLKSSLKILLSCDIILIICDLHLSDGIVSMEGILGFPLSSARAQHRRTPMVPEPTAGAYLPAEGIRVWC